MSNHNHTSNQGWPSTTPGGTPSTPAHTPSTPMSTTHQSYSNVVTGASPSAPTHSSCAAATPGTPATTPGAPSKGHKRSLKDALSDYNALEKRGQFQVGQSYLKYLEENKLYTNLANAFPKSNVKHGIRIRFPTKYPNTLVSILSKLREVYPTFQYMDPKYTKGTINLGFACKEDADEAAKAVFTIKSSGTDQHVATTQTRYSSDDCVFITLEGLPTTEWRKDIERELLSGLNQYGEVVQFEYQRNHMVPDAATPKAIALIRPNKEIAENISLIPRRAFLSINNNATDVFRVYPESAEPICPVCECLGHRASTCPTTVEGLIHTDSDNCNMEEDILTEETALLPYIWGTVTTCKIVEPVTHKERKNAARALKQAAKNKDTLAVPNPPVETPTQNAEETMDPAGNDNFMECVEEIGEDFACNEQSNCQSEFEVPSIPYTIEETNKAESINNLNNAANHPLYNPDKEGEWQEQRQTRSRSQARSINHDPSGSSASKPSSRSHSSSNARMQA